MGWLPVIDEWLFKLAPPLHALVNWVWHAHRQSA